MPPRYRVEDFQRQSHRLQMIFQDPTACLNPRMTVADIVAEPLRLQGDGGDLDARVAEVLQQVGMPAAAMARYPHEFSGGQRQRIGIARALITRPGLLICDEPISALDVSVQAQVINLLARLRRELGLSLLFIAHDLAMVRYLCDRIAVMYRGRVVELAPVAQLFANPAHPYSQLLLAANPIADPRQKHIHQDAVVATGLERESKGCGFAGRCPYAQEKCWQQRPELRSRKRETVNKETGRGEGGLHQVACYLVQEG